MGLQDQKNGGKTMKVSVIGVVGAGQMGTGIALVAALNGFPVLLYDENADAVKKAVRKIEDALDWLHTSQKLTHRQMDEAMERVSPVSFSGNPDGEMHGLRAADLIIEAITEDRDLKTDLFRRLEEVLDPRAIIVTNTSTLPIHTLVEGVDRKEKFMGMHFMNPPHVLTLIELIRGPETSEEAYRTVFDLAQRLGRTPILESPDISGFTVNGIVLPLINEAARLVGRGVASETVDKAFEGQVTTGTKPMGVLKLADLIGLDICVAGLRAMAEDDPHYEPHPLLVQMVQKGWLGRKTGRGFFSYQK
jgi:3-hydroxybutyryl-CoA dehydrogenase